MLQPETGVKGTMPLVQTQCLLTSGTPNRARFHVPRPFIALQKCLPRGFRHQVLLPRADSARTLQDAGAIRLLLDLLSGFDDGWRGR
jgi:hypothetical protein